MDFEQLKAVFFSFTLLLPRMIAAFAVLPFLGKGVMGGIIIKNGVVISMTLMLYPLIEVETRGIVIEGVDVILIILKEIFIGLVIGFLVTLPFWAVEAAGFFIDNQRGSTMASSLNPLSGSQASPLGILLVQTVTTIFFVTGMFTLFIGGLYSSYVSWPVLSFMPNFSHADAPLFFLNQMDLLLNLTVVLAAPAVIAMFLSEFGLGLISRFSPQLNVFFLSMPIKSAVAIAILILYLSVMISIFGEHMRNISGLFGALGQVI